ASARRGTGHSLRACSRPCGGSGRDRSAYFRVQGGANVEWFYMSTVETQQEFYRIQKLPPYVFAVINEMKAKARAAQQDVVDLGMGNPDGATPRAVVN